VRSLYDTLTYIILVNWEGLSDISECMLLTKNNVKYCALETENKSFTKRVGTYLPDPNAT